MKKILLLSAVFVLLAICLFGCMGADTLSNEATETSETAEQTTVPDESEAMGEEAKFFEKKQSNGLYSYKLFGRRGNVVKEVNGCTEEPLIEMIDDKFIKVTVGRDTYYYDMENNFFTDTFEDVFDENGNLIVLTKEDVLVVRDMYDSEGYYTEIDAFSFPLYAGEESPFVSAEFIDGGGSIKCVYLSENKAEMVECFNIADKTKYTVLEDYRNEKELLSVDEKNSVVNFLYSYMGKVDYNTGLCFDYEVTGAVIINGSRYYHCKCYYLMEKEDGETERVPAAEFVIGENFDERYDCRDSEGTLIIYTEKNMI